MGKRRDEIVAGLRMLVVSGELEPGNIFSENEIADRFNVSRTPVREAVAILAREGLLDQIPQVGVAVHVFSEEEIDDLLNTRHMIETHVAARLAERPPQTDDVTVLRALVDEMGRAAESSDRVVFLQSDAEFHREIAKRAGFALAADVISSVGDKIRVVGLKALYRPGGMEDVIREHSAVVDAIAVHDAHGAAAAMADHLRLTRDRLDRSQIEQN